MLRPSCLGLGAACARNTWSCHQTAPTSTSRAKLSGQVSGQWQLFATSTNDTFRFRDTLYQRDIIRPFGAGDMCRSLDSEMEGETLTLLPLQTFGRYLFSLFGEASCLGCTTCRRDFVPRTTRSQAPNDKTQLCIGLSRRHWPHASHDGFGSTADCAGLPDFKHHILEAGFCGISRKSQHIQLHAET